MPGNQDFLAITLTSQIPLNNVTPGTGALYKGIGTNGQYSVVGDTPLGILQAIADSGQQVSVGIHGVMKAVAGATIGAYARVAPTTSGYFITAASGYISVGRNLATAAVSGGVFQGAFNFINADYYDASSAYIMDHETMMMTANADLSAAIAVGLAVKISSGGAAFSAGLLTYAAAADRYLLGILETSGTSGTSLKVRLTGTVLGRAGGVVTQGIALKAVASGWLADAASGDPVIGWAVQGTAAAASGTLFRVVINQGAAPWSASVGA